MYTQEIQIKIYYNIFYFFASYLFYKYTKKNIKVDLVAYIG